VRPVGGVRGVAVDIRIISATNRDLTVLAREGRFREDLLARLAGHVVTLPALRERKEDLGLLIATLLRRIAPERTGWRLSQDAATALFLHEWPFNVRELEHMLRSAVAVSASDEIGLASLPEALRGLGSDGEGSDPQRETLLRLFEQHGGNVAAVARELKTSRSQVRRLAERYAIVVEAFRTP
jgi:transcriptional regulator of acetoin/glycerol metabolism